jgi:hypothetical protein
MQDAMEYHGEFSIGAQARVEAAKIRAARTFDTAKRGLAPMGHGSPTDVEKILRQYIMSVFATFAHEACELGCQHIWTIAQVDFAVEKFLQAWTVEAYYEKGYDTRGHRLSDMTSHTNGSILDDVKRRFRESAEWEQYQNEKLAAAESQAQRPTISGHGAAEITQRGKLLSLANMQATNLSAAVERLDVASMPSSRKAERKALSNSYFGSFPEKILVLDMCWAAKQRYREWMRWIGGRLKDGSKPDRAFRAVLTSGLRPEEYRPGSTRPKAWK